MTNEKRVFQNIYGWKGVVLIDTILPRAPGGGFSRGYFLYWARNLSLTTIWPIIRQVMCRGIWIREIRDSIICHTLTLSISIANSDGGDTYRCSQSNLATIFKNGNKGGNGVIEWMGSGKLTKKGENHLTHMESVTSQWKRIVKACRNSDNG